MKVIAKPIDMVFWSDKDGGIRPIKFRFEQNDKLQNVIKIDKIIKKELTKRAGESAFIFLCESTINGEKKLYELRYTLGSCVWVLFKI